MMLSKILTGKIMLRYVLRLNNPRTEVCKGGP